MYISVEQQKSSDEKNCVERSTVSGKSIKGSNICGIRDPVGEKKDPNRKI